jgi:hypothetical protein
LSKIRREKHKGSQQCRYCSDKAVIRFKARIDGRIHMTYSCSKHERKAKSDLEGSW